MPPKTEIKDRVVWDLNLAVNRTVKAATNDQEVDAAWQKLYGPARDGLSLIYWRLLIAEKQTEGNGTS